MLVSIWKEEELQLCFWSKRHDFFFTYFHYQCQHRHRHLIETSSPLDEWISLTRCNCVIYSYRFWFPSNLASLRWSKRHKPCLVVQTPMDSGTHCGRFAWTDWLCDLLCRLWCKTFWYPIYTLHSMNSTELIQIFLGGIKFQLRIKLENWTICGVASIESIHRVLWRFQCTYQEYLAILEKQ